MPLPTKILIAEDETSLRTVLKKMFLKKEFEVETCGDGLVAVHKLLQENFDLAILDLKMPEKSGLEILSEVHLEKPELPILLMTAQDTMQNAVEAMKRGAFDYLTKPFELDELEVIVERALNASRLSQEVAHLKAELHHQKFDPQSKLIGKSKGMLEIYKLMGKVSASNVPVVITGESGTGKELIAKSIHYSSQRATFPFIAVNCASIPKDLLESELFGYKKGAFTGATESRMGYFEAANKGTLFLDEIGDMSLSLQAKLLRVVQEQEVQRLGSSEALSIDVRILSATNQILPQLVAEKKFREDLFFRLNVVPIHVPPLRERREDIPILTDYFLQKFAHENSQPLKQISATASKVLEKHNWPGNVRELENGIKHLAVMSNTSLIQENEVQEILKKIGSLPKTSELENLSLEEVIHDKLSLFLTKLGSLDDLHLYDTALPLLERPLIRLVLQKTKGNQIQAAKALGLNRNTLRKKIRELKIHFDRYALEEDS